MKKISNILNLQNKNILIYLFSDLLAKALPFIFIPLFTKYLTPEQYGNISLFNVGVEIFIIIIIMGGNSYYKIEYKNFKEPVSALYNIMFNVAMVFLICFLISWILYFFFNSSYLFTILPIIVFCSFLQSLFYLYISYYQCNERASIVGVMNLLFSIANTLLMVILLTLFNLKESSRYLSLGLALVFSVLIIGLFLTKSNQCKISIKINMPLIKFGIGVLPHAISWWARSGMERLLIGWYLSVSVLGLYSLAMQLTSLMPLFCNAVNQALLPRIVRSLDLGNKEEAKGMLFKATLGVTLVCLMSSLILPIVLKYFLNHRYFDALHYLPYMILAFVFQSVIILYGNVLYFYKHVNYLSMVTFCTSVLHVCLIIVTLHYKPDVYSVIISSTATFIIAAFLVLKRAMLLLRGEK